MQMLDDAVSYGSTLFGLSSSPSVVSVEVDARAAGEIDLANKDSLPPSTLGTTNGGHSDSETTMGEMMELIKSLQDTVAAQGTQIEALVAVLVHKEQPPADPLIDKLEDLYSYCLEMLVYPDSAYAAALLTVKLIAMVSVQALLAFGFYDASVLAIFQGNTNLLGGPISESSFYPDNSIAYAPSGNAVPIINVLASIIGLLLICQAMHKDAMATLFYPPPLALLLHIRAEGVSAWRFVSCVLLQFAWAIRTVFLPVAAALGTANLMASADSAVDVVLNSVAVAFVFDLDEMAYETLLNPSERRDYVRSPSRLPKQLVPSVSKATSNFHVGWTCYLIDVGFTVYVFCFAVWQLPLGDQPGFDEVAQERTFLVYCLVRGVLWAVLHVYRNAQAIQRLKRAKKPIGSLCTLAIKNTVGVVTCIASGIGSYALCWLVMHSKLGSINGLANLDEVGPLSLCLGAYVPDENCAASAVMFVPVLPAST